MSWAGSYTFFDEGFHRKHRTMSDTVLYLNNDAWGGPYVGHCIKPLYFSTRWSGKGSSVIRYAAVSMESYLTPGRTVQGRWECSMYCTTSVQYRCPTGYRYSGSPVRRYRRQLKYNNILWGIHVSSWILSHTILGRWYLNMVVDMDARWYILVWFYGFFHILFLGSWYLNMDLDMDARWNSMDSFLYDSWKLVSEYGPWHGHQVG